MTQPNEAFIRALEAESSFSHNVVGGYYIPLDKAISLAKTMLVGGAPWRDISTAPRDGAAFLAFIGEESAYTILSYSVEDCEPGFYDIAEDYIPQAWISHWTPLPPAPGERAPTVGGTEQQLREALQRLADEMLGVMMDGIEPDVSGLGAFAQAKAALALPAGQPDEGVCSEIPVKSAFTDEANLKAQISVDRINQIEAHAEEGHNFGKSGNSVILELIRHIRAVEKVRDEWCMEYARLRDRQQTVPATQCTVCYGKLDGNEDGGCTMGRCWTHSLATPEPECREAAPPVEESKAVKQLGQDIYDEIFDAWLTKLVSDQSVQAHCQRLADKIMKHLRPHLRTQPIKADLQKCAMALKAKWLGTQDIGANPGISWAELARAVISAIDGVQVDE